MIERIGHVKVSPRIQRDGPRIIELSRLAACAADDLHRLTIRLKNLGWNNCQLPNQNVSPLFPRPGVGITQLAQTLTPPYQLPDEFPIRRKNLNPMIARIRHV